MTTPEEPTDKQKAEGICVWYDNPKSPDMLYVSIPLRHLAANEFGTVFLRGFIEEQVKAIALLNIARIRQEKVNKLILASKPKGDNGQPLDMKVL